MVECMRFRFWRELNLIPKTSTAQEWPLCWNGLGADTVWDPNNALPTLRTTVMLKIMGRWWHLGAVPWVFVDAGMLVFSTLKMEECHNFWPETSRIQGSTHLIISGQFLTMSSQVRCFLLKKKSSKLAQQIGDCSRKLPDTFVTWHI